VITNHFASDKGVLAAVERLTAPFASILGWHSDFEIAKILGEPSLSVVEKKSLPPIGMMTFLVLQKERAA
jgi:phosphatidylethanolamine/phosphatidyl-N-methylethanolamine N-methyltransferase